jgi:hypothetical protein
VGTRSETVDKTMVEGSANLRIGPFTFGGSGGSIKEVKQTTDKTSTTEIITQHIDLCVLGYICQVLPKYPSIDPPKSLLYFLEREYQNFMFKEQLVFEKAANVL